MTNLSNKKNMKVFFNEMVEDKSVDFFFKLPPRRRTLQMLTPLPTAILSIAENKFTHQSWKIFRVKSTSSSWTSTFVSTEPAIRFIFKIIQLFFLKVITDIKLASSISNPTRYSALLVFFFSDILLFEANSIDYK